MTRLFFAYGLMLFLVGLPMQVQAKPARLSLNIQKVDVRSAIYVLAEVADVDMVISDAVNSQISLRVHDIGWEQLLELILKSNGLEQQRYGRIIHIVRQEEALARDKQQFERAQQRHRLHPVQTTTFTLHHRQASDLKKMLEDGKVPSEQGQLLADIPTNTLFASDRPEHIERMRAILTHADTPVRQVMIEARIVEANDNFSRDLGVKLNFARVRSNAQAGDPSVAPPMPQSKPRRDRDVAPAGIDLPVSRPFGSIAALFTASASTLISLELQAMQEENRGQVISSPRLLTADRTPALIEEGSETPYTQTSVRGAHSTQFKKAALSLKVTPQIAPDSNSLWIEIDLSKDSPNAGPKSSGAPSVNTKRIQTRVQVENGGTVVIGGIFVENHSQTNQSVPLLADLPLIGFLFRSQQTQQHRRELLVFLTPRIFSTI
jgi:type IV pilus assembly protein PilQ